MTSACSMFLVCENKSAPSHRTRRIANCNSAQTQSDWISNCNSAQTQSDWISIDRHDVRCASSRGIDGVSSTKAIDPKLSDAATCSLLLNWRLRYICLAVNATAALRTNTSEITINHPHVRVSKGSEVFTPCIARNINDRRNVKKIWVSTQAFRELASGSL
jgi:hypothetical protein